MHGRNSGPSNAGISKARRACDIRDGAIAVPPPRNGPVGRHVYLQRSDQKGINFSGCRAVVPAAIADFCLAARDMSYVRDDSRLIAATATASAQRNGIGARDPSRSIMGLVMRSFFCVPSCGHSPTLRMPAHGNASKSEARIKERRHFAPWRHEDCATIFCSSPSTQPFR